MSAEIRPPTGWKAAVALLVGAAATVAAQNTPPRLVISSPQTSTYLSGATEFRADVDTPSLFATLTFYVDGRQVCVIDRPPFECTWDAGPSVAARQIRLVADLVDGTRVTRTLRTRGLDEYAENVAVDAIQVTVTVTDGDNKPVGRLDRSRFRVFEDDRPQRIVNFAAEQIPLELVVAVDISGSMAAVMTPLRNAVGDFLRTVPAGDPVTPLAFNDRVVPLARRATDPDERVRNLNRLAAWGATALYDTIVMGTDLLSAQGGRKALVVFTDGEDSGSRVALDDVERRLEASDVTLYMIGQGRGLTHESLKRVMERLVNPTGGRVFSTDDIDELQDAFDDLLEELSNQYQLTYQTTNTTRDTAWRRIRVEVDGYSNVRARDGYRAVPAR
jgi:Ca-activated chloride channel family protein